MLRISKLTDYATVILARLAAQPERRFTAGQTRGRNPPGRADGVKTAQAAAAARPGSIPRAACTGATCWRARPAQITAAHILDALEGPVALTECASSESHCCIESSCLVGRAWQRVNLAIRRSLQEITLLELAGLSSGGQLSLRARSRFPAC